MIDQLQTFDLIIGLDRSDAKADLHLIQSATGQTQSCTIASSLG